MFRRLNRDATKQLNSTVVTATITSLLFRIVISVVFIFALLHASSRIAAVDYVEFLLAVCLAPRLRSMFLRRASKPAATT